jgi:hypothetical protein
MDSDGQDDGYMAPLGKIRTVAIIGAGLSGIVSAVHLLRAGLDVAVFERAAGVGGAWEYSPQPDRDPPFPSTRPPVVRDRAGPRGVAGFGPWRGAGVSSGDRSCPPRPRQSPLPHSGGSGCEGGRWQRLGYWDVQTRDDVSKLHVETGGSGVRRCRRLRGGTASLAYRMCRVYLPGKTCSQTG